MGSTGHQRSPSVTKGLKTVASCHHSSPKMPLSKISDFWGLLIPLAFSVLLGWKALWLNMSFAAITAAIIWYYKRRIGCITGDMLGAMTEITEAGLFLLASIGGNL